MRSLLVDKPVIEQARRSRRAALRHMQRTCRTGIPVLKRAMARDEPRPSLITKRAFERAMMIWGSRGGRAWPIALPAGPIDPAELRHVLGAIKCTYPSNGDKNG